VYGVAIADGDVAASETTALRANIATQRATRPAFDFGPGRSAWEATYGVAAEHIAAWLPTLAEGVRRHAQAEVYHQLRESGPGPYDGAATEQAMQLVETKLPANAGRAHHE
jgi:hypothetical protein